MLFGWLSTSYAILYGWCYCSTVLVITLKFVLIPLMWATWEYYRPATNEQCALSIVMHQHILLLKRELCTINLSWNNTYFIAVIMCNGCVKYPRYRKLPKFRPIQLVAQLQLPKISTKTAKIDVNGDTLKTTEIIVRLMIAWDLTSKAHLWATWSRPLHSKWIQTQQRHNHCFTTLHDRSLFIMVALCVRVCGKQFQTFMTLSVKKSVADTTNVCLE